MPPGRGENPAFTLTWKQRDECSAEEVSSAAGLELLPGISPTLVTLVPGTAVAKDIPAKDTIIPG